MGQWSCPFTSRRDCQASCGMSCDRMVADGWVYSDRVPRSLARLVARHGFAEEGRRAGTESTAEFSDEPPDLDEAVYYRRVWERDEYRMPGPTRTRVVHRYRYRDPEEFRNG